MAHINTALTRLLGSRLPLVLPPMSGAAGGVLAARVTQAGGFGFIGAGHRPVADLVAEIEKGRAALSLNSTEPLPFGIGLQLWQVEAPHGKPELAQHFLDVILAAKPAAIWLSFGADLHSWVERVRSLEKQRGLSRNKVFVNVWSVAMGQAAAQWPEVDVVVAQGSESGGHGPKDGLPLVSLLSALRPSFARPNSPLLLGAGGIVTGRQLVSVLPHASGAVMGTAFLATPECIFSQKQKELIVRSRGEDTVRTMTFDHARGTLGWGEGVDGRGLKNVTSEGEKIQEVGCEDGRKVYAEAVKAGDITRIVTWAGTSVGDVKDHSSAEQVVLRIEREAIEALDELEAMRAASKV